MAVAYQSQGATFQAAAQNNNWAVAYPAIVNAGDILVLHVSTNGGGVTDPSGWAIILNPATVTNPRGGMWLKVAAGTEGGGTLTVAVSGTTGAVGDAVITRYAGADQATPQDATATSVQNTGLATIIIPAITTVTANTLLVYGGALNSATVTCTAPGTERVDYGAAALSKSGAIYDEAFVGPGSTGTRTITPSATRANWGAMLALRPAAAAALPDLVMARYQP